METLPYPIGLSEYRSLLLTRSSITRVNSPKPISLFYNQALRSSSTWLRTFPSSSRSFLYLRCASETADHHHNRHHHHEDHNHHHHHHCDDGAELTGPQKAFLRFAKAVKWTDLADFLREHLHLCCFSTSLFLAAAVCPYLLPKPSIAKPLQNAFIYVAFPLVGVYFHLKQLLLVELSLKFV